MGRPPKNPELLAKAVEEARSGRNVDDVAKEYGYHRATLFKALKRTPYVPPAAADQKLVQVPRPPRTKPSAAESLGKIATTDEQTEQIRRFVVAGDFGARGVASLALSLDTTTEAIRELLLDAAALEVADRLPADLARAESIAFARKGRQACRENGDARGALAFQAHLDRLYGVDPRVKAGDMVPRAEVVAILRRAAAALAPWPDALEAYKSAVRNQKAGESAA